MRQGAGRGLTAVVVVAGAVTAISSCAGSVEGRPCAVAMPPTVMLDVSAWEHARAGTTLRVCADAACLTAPPDQVGPLRVPVTGEPDRAVTLSVTGYRNGRQAVFRTSRSIRLRDVVASGPCGTVSSWLLSLQLTAAGTLVPI